MNTVQKREHIHPRYWSYFLVIASLLIGLGAGLLTGYAGSGVFIGLGLGILGSTFMHRVEHVDGVVVVQPRKSNWGLVLLGLVFIVFGMGIVLALWPYIIAFLFIVLGIWVLVHGYVRPYYILMRK
jgi:hypothetical protein